MRIAETQKALQRTPADRTRARMTAEAAHRIRHKTRRRISLRTELPTEVRLSTIAINLLKRFQGGCGESCTLFSGTKAYEEEYDTVRALLKRYGNSSFGGALKGRGGEGNPGGSYESGIDRS